MKYLRKIANDPDEHKYEESRYNDRYNSIMPTEKARMLPHIKRIIERTSRMSGEINDKSISDVLDNMLEEIVFLGEDLEEMTNKLFELEKYLEKLSDSDDKMVKEMATHILYGGGDYATIYDSVERLKLNKIW